MSSNDLSQQLQCGSKTVHVQVHPGTPETQGDPYVLLEDIQEHFQEHFPDTAKFACGDRLVSLMRDVHDNELQPKRFAHQPGEVVEITTTAISTCPPGYYDANFISPRHLTGHGTISQSTSVEPQARSSQDGQKEQADLIQSDFQQCFFDVKAPMAENNDLQQQQIGEKSQMQQQGLDQPAVVQGRIHALLGQTYDLHECPLPRLFIILPKENAAQDHASSLDNQFRLYFLCECGEHTRVPNDDSVHVPHHIHLVKHEGYDLQRPNEFFQLYGRHMMTLLEMIKYGVTTADFDIPALSTVNVSGTMDISKDALNVISESDVNQSIKHLRQFANNVPAEQDSARFDEAESFNGLDALEGGHLRQMKELIRDTDEHWVPANLYRIATQQGHVKWICVDHYRLVYKEIEEHALANAVAVNRGSYQPQLGQVSITLGSYLSAARFFKTLATARHMVDLDISFAWDCSRSDLEALASALMNLTVRMLRLELQQFQTSLISKLFSKSTRHEVLFRMIGHPSLRTIHIVIPKDIAKRSILPPNTSWYFSNSSFEMIARSVGGSGALELCNSLKTNSTLTALHLVGNSIGDGGARALSEALKTNSTLTSLDLVGNSIRDDGARAMAEALKINSTLTTLDLRDNLIWYRGFLAFSEIVRTNTTMTTLDLRGNLIGSNSALAFADALESRSAIATLSLYHSSIGDQGARALAEAVKTNSTLIALDLGSNLIGDNGAVALSGALEINTTLTTLDLRVNAIGDDGALAVFGALKVNLTLTTLNLGWNMIKDNGAQALSQALKINSTLTMLYLGSNSIGDKGAHAMSQGLGANSSLTTLYLGSNEIGDDGAQALAEALKINSTLTTLDLYHNLIGNKAAQALSESIKINSTLTTLYLGWNIIEDNGIIALTEAFETNTTLAMLYVVGNSFGDNGVRALYQVSKTSQCEITHGILDSTED
ncbi:hypothetical protein BGZ67_009086 [Mortierella alpina]|nr:hypothetical protein BGZ67_009086 [Mortierella alpina]